MHRAGKPFHNAGLSPALIGIICALALLAGGLDLRAQPKVVAYVPNWIDLQAFAPTIDFQKVTHINIAFENPKGVEGELSFSPQNQVLIEVARSNRVPVLVSIGGGAASSNQALRERYFELMNRTNRARFAARIADYLTLRGFDGLDVDIEGPSINEDYGAFIAELAGPLRARGKLLTAALSKGYGGAKVPSSVFPHFDFVNIMAYDGAGYWSPDSPGQHSSFEFATNNVAYWLERGLPCAKAVLGLPFYGYGFGEAFRRGDYPYKRILEAHPGVENTDQAGRTIWFNGIPTIRAKSRYALEQQLAGVMIWSLDYDVPGERSLLGAIHEGFRQGNTGAGR